MRAMPSFTSRTGTDFLDVQVGKVGSGNLTEENVLDFARAKAVWVAMRRGR